jgi:hypothetical protein
MDGCRLGTGGGQNKRFISEVFYPLAGARGGVWMQIHIVCDWNGMLLRKYPNAPIQACHCSTWNDWTCSLRHSSTTVELVLVWAEAQEWLFHHEGGHWAIYSKVPLQVWWLWSKKLSKQFYFDDILPKDAAHISVSQWDRNITITRISTFDDAIPTPGTPTTIAEALLQQPCQDQWASQSVECGGNVLYLTISLGQLEYTHNSRLI